MYITHNLYFPDNVFVIKSGPIRLMGSTGQYTQYVDHRSSNEETTSETIGVDLSRILMLEKGRRENSTFLRSIALGCGLDGR